MDILQITEQFTKRPVWAQIDLDAVAENMRHIRQVVGPDVEIAAVVKANAYGHGAVEMSEVFLQSGADCLAVACLDEAMELRRAGMTVPILILGHTDGRRAEELIANDVETVVFQYADAELFSKAAQKMARPVRLHIAADTGMGRIGYRFNRESVEEIKAIAALPNVELVGISTHFASADLADEESLAYTKKQYELFDAFCRRLAEEGVHIRVRHCCSSAGLLEHPDFHLEMVRPGIIQYGYDPSEEMPSHWFVPKPVMSLHCCVTCVKVIESGETISYGRCFKAERPTKIATLPIGYADGYSRLLSNRVDVLIHGRRAPQVGNVCMDQCMVDVTDVPDVAVGDEVVLFGRQGAEEIPLGELARILGTIDHEVLCNINRRVPRVYVKGGKIVKRVEYLFP